MHMTLGSYCYEMGASADHGGFISADQFFLALASSDSSRGHNAISTEPYTEDKGRRQSLEGAFQAGG